MPSFNCFNCSFRAAPLLQGMFFSSDSLWSTAPFLTLHVGIDRCIRLLSTVTTLIEAQVFLEKAVNQMVLYFLLPHKRVLLNQSKVSQRNTKASIRLVLI